MFMSSCQPSSLIFGYIFEYVDCGPIIGFVKNN